MCFGSRKCGSPLLLTFFVSAAALASCEIGDDKGVYGSAAERGGALYDKYWAVNGQARPEGEHPLWPMRPDRETNTRSGPDTWRCKECHGWDYQGKDGQYGRGSHATGIGGILGTALDEDDIVDELTGDHGYGDVLSTRDLEDLAAFVVAVGKDPPDIIRNTEFTGAADEGEPLYETHCRRCHGADGLDDKPTGSAGDFEDYPGKLANENAHEFLHKVRFGQPGTDMPPRYKLSDGDLADLGAYVQTLPTGKK